MIEIKEVSKKYGKVKALERITFNIEKGDIVGFIGPNGAGKTTTMNIITGCLSATSGECLIDGKNISKEHEEAKKLMGYLPEVPPLYSSFSVYEYLSCVYDIKGIKLDKKSHIYEIADMTGISEVLDRNCANLSKGYKQRTGIAYAMLGYPDYIILDEPTSGLDPQQKHEMLEFIKRLGKNKGILLSSHILSEIDAVCNRFVMIDKGRIVNSVAKDNLVQTHKYIYKIKGDKKHVLSVIKMCEGIYNVQCGEADTYIVEMTDKGMENIFYALAQNHLLILQQQPYMINVEKMFLETIRKNKQGKTI